MDRTDLDNDKLRLERHIRFLDFRKTQLPQLIHEQSERVARLEDELAREQRTLNVLEAESSNLDMRRESAVADLGSIAARHRRVEEEKQREKAMAEMSTILASLRANGMTEEQISRLMSGA